MSEVRQAIGGQPPAQTEDGVPEPQARVDGGPAGMSGPAVASLTLLGLLLGLRFLMVWRGH